MNSFKPSTDHLYPNEFLEIKAKQHTKTVLPGTAWKIAPANQTGPGRATCAQRASWMHRANPCARRELQAPTCNQHKERYVRNCRTAGFFKTRCPLRNFASCAFTKYKVYQTRCPLRNFASCAFTKYKVYQARCPLRNFASCAFTKYKQYQTRCPLPYFPS